MCFDSTRPCIPRACGGRLPRRLLFCFMVFVHGGTCLSKGPDNAELGQALDTVVAARPGADSEPVAKAWKVIAQADYEQLPLILQAVDKADGLAANWISMALDRMVQSRGVEKLPCDVLKNIALSTEHALLTRKMALELLGRVDPRLVDALQPELMHDPEAELRRPAIEKEITRARELAVRNAAQQQQLEAWLSILPAARDQDQVVQVVRALKELGRDVDLGAQFGYLVDWYVIGPFDNTDGQHYDTPYPPESLTLQGYEDIVSGVAGKQKGKSGEIAWKKVRAKATNGDVALNDEIEKLRDVLGYGATVFVSDGPRQVDVRLRIQNSFKIWLNGKLLLEQPVGHTGNSFDQYTVRADLQAGRNLFVVKSCQVNLSGATEFYDNWHFCVRVCDSTGAAILSADRVALPQVNSTEKGADQ